MGMKQMLRISFQFYYLHSISRFVWYNGVRFAGRVKRAGWLGGGHLRDHRKETLALWGFVLVWLSLNLLLLTRYPLVHSDESWLGGLTRNMLAQGSPGVTEPFFD